MGKLSQALQGLLLRGSQRDYSTRTQQCPQQVPDLAHLVLQSHGPQGLYQVSPQGGQRCLDVSDHPEVILDRAPVDHVIVALGALGAALAVDTAGFV